jgi:hypothetical protein
VAALVRPPAGHEGAVRRFQSSRRRSCCARPLRGTWAVIRICCMPIRSAADDGPATGGCPGAARARAERRGELRVLPVGVEAGTVAPGPRTAHAATPRLLVAPRAIARRPWLTKARLLRSVSVS